MNFNGYVVKNSFIHRMNPSLKFLTVCFVIAMIFIPFGFFYQSVLLVFCLTLYFVAKLPVKKLWNIIQSVIFMAIILTLVNWFTYKGPGVVFDVESKLTFFGLPSFFKDDNIHTTLIGNKWFVQGSMYGGHWLDSITFNVQGIEGSITLNSKNGFIDLWTINGNELILSNGIKVSSSSDALFTKLVKQLSNEDSVLGKLRYYTEVVNINGEAHFYAYFYRSPWYGFSSEAISLMLFVTIKIFLMILIVTILTSTTSSIQLTNALEDILNPLRFLRLPVTEWSTTIALGLRFIPSLLDESNRIMKAQASRGLDFKNGNLKDKVTSLISLVVPLFSIAFKKAGELANAMESRCYNPRNARTRYREYSIYAFDWIIFSLSCFMFGILIALATILPNPIFVNVFGIHEVLAIL